MIDLKQLYDAIVTGDAKTSRSVTEQALKDGADPLKLVMDHMAPAMSEVGRRFECNDYFVPELLLSARAMKAAMELIRPLLTAQGAQPVGRVAIGTVKGDLHDIGKNLVGMMLTGGGLKVVDVGTDAPPEKFVQAAKDNNAQIIAMSALLTTTMPQMPEVVKAVKGAGLKVKTMIGGAPVTQRFADEIGADGYAPDAASAVDTAMKLIKG